MPVYQLGNGNDYFNSYSQPDWAANSTVFGGNGNDTILADGLLYAPAGNIFVDGGNGDDAIVLDTGNSVAFGGNGDDTLTAQGGLNNTLIGGNGDDTLISLGGGSGMGPGNTLTGGLGRDTFILQSGTGNLVVTNDAAGDGVVSDGDTFKGPMDVITDYQQGEHITLREYSFNGNDFTTVVVPVARVDSVTLAPDPLSNTGNTFRPLVDSGKYAVFHGTFAGGNTFTVGAGGPDLFVEYNTDLGPTDPDPVGRGSLVLLGVTDEQLVAEAFSSATMSNAGSGQYTYDFPGSGNSPNQTGGIHVANFDGSNSPSIGVPPGNLIAA